MIITTCAILVTIIGWYFIEFKVPYKVKHWIWTVVFFVNMFGAKAGAFNNINHFFNGLIYWICLAAGVWHLTKACFFIDEKELEARTKKENA